MASIVLIDPTITIATIDMSSFISEIGLDVEADDVENTAFGSAPRWRTRLGGLRSGEVKVTFNDDFDASTVDDRIWTWFGTVVTFNVRADSGAISATNPEYQGNVLVNKATPLAGAVGELAKSDLSWPLTGTLTRATS